MSKDEIDLLVAAMNEIRSDNETDSMFKYLVDQHIINAPFVHSWPVFLPWHRMWLFLFEQELRKIDCRVTVPYFDFTQHWQDWWAHSPFDAEHIGGDGESGDCCVSTGPFRKGLWNVTEFLGGGCLCRTFNKEKLMPSPKMATIALSLWKPNQMHLVSNFINIYFHNLLHDAMGGFMYLASAGVDPAFWMLHGYLDKMWSSWQERGLLYKKAVFTKMTGNVMLGSPPGANYTPADFYDSWNQAKMNVRVCYSGQMSDEEALAKGQFTAPSTPRRKKVRNFSASEIVRVLRSLTKGERKQFAMMLGLATGTIPDSHVVMPNDCLWKIDSNGKIKTKRPQVPGLKLAQDLA